MFRRRLQVAFASASTTTPQGWPYSLAPCHGSHVNNKAGEISLLSRIRGIVSATPTLFCSGGANQSSSQGTSSATLPPPLSPCSYTRSELHELHNEHRHDPTLWGDYFFRNGDSASPLEDHFGEHPTAPPGALRCAACGCTLAQHGTAEPCNLTRDYLEAGKDRTLIQDGICKSCWHPITEHETSEERKSRLKTIEVRRVERLGIDGVEKAIQSLIDSKRLKPRTQWDLGITCFFPKGVKVFNPEVDEVVGEVPYEPRKEACSILLSRFDREWTNLQRHEPGQFTHDSSRLPLVANVGFGGTGKTTCLYLSCRAFVKQYTGSRAIFITFNAGTETAVENENPARIGQRILHSLCSSWAMNDVLDLSELPSCTTKDAVEFVRKTLELKPEQHVLLAVDELQKTLFPNDSLTLLTAAMTESFITASTLPKNKRFVTYLVASAYSAVDAFHVLTKNSNRPVDIQPLPPLTYTEAKGEILLRQLHRHNPHGQFWVPGVTSAWSYGTKALDRAQIRMQVLGAMWDVGMHPRMLHLVFHKFVDQPQNQNPVDFEAWRQVAVVEAFNLSGSKTWLTRYEEYGRSREKLILTHLFLPRQSPHPDLPVSNSMNLFQMQQRYEASELHEAQTHGLISVSRKVSGDQLVLYTTSAPMASILAESAAENDPNDKFIKEVAMLVKELKRWNAPLDEGKQFEKIIFQALLSALLARENPIQLSALFDYLPLKYQEMRINVQKFRGEYFRFCPKDQKYPFGTADVIDECGVVAPLDLHKYNEGVDFVLNLPMVGGGSLEVFIQCKDWFHNFHNDPESERRVDIVAEFRKCQKRLKTLKPKGLHVLVSMNEIPTALKRSPGSQYDEGFLDQTKLIREVCPFVFESCTTAATFKNYCHQEVPEEEG